MELRHLRYFVRVAEELNFTKAAEKLRIAQPALSRQIRDLEDEVGVDFFKRSTRGVTLTAEGKLFLAETLGLLATLEQAVERVRALTRGDYGELNVGYSPTPTTEFLNPVLTRFRKAAPGINLSLHDLAGNELIAGLRDGSLDLALMQRPLSVAAGSLIFETMRSYPICVAMAKDHPLAKRRRLTTDDLSDHSLAVLRKRDYGDYHELLDRVFSGKTSRPRFAMECDGASSLIAALESSTLLAVLPQVYQMATRGRILVKPLQDCDEKLEVGLVRAEKGDLTPATERFCEVTRAIAGESPGARNQSSA